MRGQDSRSPSRWHCMAKSFLECAHRLVRAITRRGRTVDLGRAVFVVTQREFRTGDVLDGRDRVERHGVAAGVSHEELANVFRVGAIIAFGLYIYLPCSPEPIEIVHKKTAHERLEGLIDLAEIDSLLDDFVAIDVDEDLRH